MQIRVNFSALFSVLLTVFVVGCGSQEGARSALTGKVGAAGEVVVVCDEVIWNGEVGDSLRSIFDHPFPVLPQYEPWFKLVHLEPEAFDRFWKPHRNIVVLELADRVDTQAPQVSIYKEKYSRDQIYVTGVARRAADLAKALSDESEALIGVFHRAEVERYADLIALDENEVIRAELGRALNWS